MEKKQPQMVREIITQLIIRRKELGWTQEDLAERTNMKQAAIARLETFRVVPTIDTVAHIASSMGLRLMLR